MAKAKYQKRWSREFEQIVGKWHAPRLSQQVALPLAPRSTLAMSFL
jgi:hypothetical protein